MNGFGWVDIAIFGVIIISFVIGLFRGFVKEALSLLNWVIAIWMGVYFHDTVSGWFLNLIHSDTIRSIAGFGLVFVSFLFIGSIITYFISVLVKKSGMSGTDRLLGLVFGMGRGVFLVALVLTVVGYSALKEQPFWQDSLLIPKFEPLMVWLNDIVPSKINVAKDAVFVKPTKSMRPKGLQQMAAVGLDELSEIQLLEEDK